MFLASSNFGLRKNSRKNAWCLRKSMFKKDLCKLLRYRFPTTSRSKKKQSMEWKHTDSTVKQKFWAQRLVTRVIPIVFWTWKISSLLISLRKCNYNQCFLLTEKIILFLEWRRHKTQNSYQSSYKIGGARGVTVIVVGNGHGDTSSNPGPGWLHFT